MLVAGTAMEITMGRELQYPRIHNSIFPFTSRLPLMKEQCRNAPRSWQLMTMVCFCYLCRVIWRLVVLQVLQAMPPNGKKQIAYHLFWKTFLRETASSPKTFGEKKVSDWITNRGIEAIEVAKSLARKNGFGIGNGLSTELLGLSWRLP